jgi:hypothetical protein
VIWLVWLRVAALPGCKVTPDGAEPALECALSAPTSRELPSGELRETLDAALRSHRYRVAEIEACLRFDPRDWHEANDRDGRVRAAAAAASTKGGVHFASFGRRPPASSA